MPTLVGMRVELPPGYVPPEPTHPHYGYLTPEEQDEFEASERARVGIVPGVPAEPVLAGEPVEVTWSSPVAAVDAPEVLEVEEATVAHTGWVPEPPSEVPAAATLGEFRWDARAQQWVEAEAPVAEEPAPDVAAAAGGRGASSSWTSADGARYRWDARAQQWVTDPPDGPG